ncbi:MAG: DUF4230 domain-containing protein [Labilithrix sp.]|nr:DUF4230 domain-containing protein [Labilithrix sp.]
MSTPAPPSLTLTLARFAWPAAFVAVVAMTLAYLRDARPPPASEIRVEHPTPTVLKDLRELARLETASLHVEKIVEVKDRQHRLYGLVDAEDSLLFVATGEVILGVDLAKLADGDVRFDEATRTAYVTLPAPEVLSTRIDEPKSYVHARTTDVLAKRNEALESVARRDAAAAFAAAGKDAKSIARAKEQAEKQIRTLVKASGARDAVITWQAEATSSELGLTAGP